MAKRLVKTKGIKSQGIHSNVSASTRKLMRDGVSDGAKWLNKMTAYRKGQNPWITIDNPNKEETNKRRIRVKSNDLYGRPKNKFGYAL
ncbi:MAG: hypothetical protein COA84_12960 [Robiginitomaculum sp.]|nr:MAG: hypothetical protein COA84_12960 [Robiginitomaculum sp.]